jgi:hypothetical protein
MVAKLQWLKNWLAAEGRELERLTHGTLAYESGRTLTHTQVIARATTQQKGQKEFVKLLRGLALL